MGTVTVGMEGIGGSATLGMDGIAGIGGNVTFGITTAGIGGKVTCGTVIVGTVNWGTVIAGTAGMGGNVTCGTVIAGTAGIGGTVTCGVVITGMVGIGGSVVGMVGTGGFGAGIPGTAAGVAVGAAASVVSASRRPAWVMLPLRRARAMAMGKTKLKALAAMLGSCRALGFVGDKIAGLVLSLLGANIRDRAWTFIRDRSECD
jgi:hypothetical protein